MTEIFLKGLERLEELFSQLYDGEPSPDEEINAQQEMVIIFESLIDNLGNNMDIKPLLDQTLLIVKNWDTLDKWFVEIPELVTNFKKILGKPLDAKPLTEAPPPPQSTMKPSMQGIIPGTTPSLIQEPNLLDSDEPSFEPEMQSNQAVLNTLAAQTSQKIKKTTQRSKTRSKLSPPKVTIPKVTKPIKKIVPREDLEYLGDITPSNEVKPPEPKKIVLLTPKKSAPKVDEKPKKKAKPVIKPIVQVQDSSVVEEIPMLETASEILQPSKLKVTAIESGEEVPFESSLPEPPKFQPKDKAKSRVRLHVSVKPEIKVDRSNLTSIDKPFTEMFGGKLPRLPDQNESTNLEQTPKFNIVKPDGIKIKDSKDSLFNALLGKNETQKKTGSPLEDIVENIIAQESGDQNFGFLENIPQTKLTKEELYQELIALEGKKYAIEKARKEVRQKHQEGNMKNDAFQAALDRIKYDLDIISKRINDTREKIQAL